MGYADELFSEEEKKKLSYSDEVFGDVVPMGEGLPVSKRGYIFLPEEGSAGFVTNLLANLPTDPATKARVAGERLFPNNPELQSRVKTLSNGDIVVETEGGNLRKIDSGFLSGLGEATAYAPETIGGLAGALTPNPIIGSTLGATAGKAFKQIFSNVAQDEPQTVMGNVEGLTWEAVPNLLFGWAGKGASSLINRRAITELGRVDTPAAEATIQRIKDLTGIELDLAQATGNPWLKSLKTWATSFPGEASEVAQAHRLMQAGQVDEAIKRVLSAVSTEPAETAGARGINAAKAALESARMARDAAADPLYKRAYASGARVELAPTLRLIDERMAEAKGPIRSALMRAQHLLEQGAKKEAIDGREVLTLDQSVRGVHNVTRALSEMIEGSGGKILGRETKRELVGIRNSLLESLDAASPDYKMARQIWREQSEKVVTPLQESVIGVLAEIPNKEAARAGAMLFQGRLPDVAHIRYAKAHILNAESKNPELKGAWDGLVRQFLEGRYEMAAKMTTTGKQMNTAGRFRELIVGTESQRRALNEMLGPEASRQMDVVLEALEMVSRTPTATSLTEFNRLISERFKGQTASLIKFFAQPFQSIVGTIDDKFLQDNAKRVILGITDPTKRALLKKLQTLSPGKERALLIAAVVLGQAAGNEGEQLVR